MKLSNAPTSTALAIIRLELPSNCIAFRSWVAIAATAITTFISTPATSQEGVVSNPPELKVLRGAELENAQFRRRRPVRHEQNESLAELRVVYTYARIWNSLSEKFDVVRLRSFNGPLLEQPTNENGWADAEDLVGPTIRLNPSETARITLKNDLPDEGCVKPEATHNVPNCFNVTNLHAHGLHVSPAGNGDNVLVEIWPGKSFEYEYNIPADHPAGTFWYHSHRHGSTAIQVSSGMAGALIVNGNRKPVKEGMQYLPGDIDILLKTASERVLLLQQIQYACRDPKTAAIMHVRKDDPESPWSCERDNEGDPIPIGGLEGYDQFVPDSWVQSGRHTLVNGKLQPVLSVGGPFQRPSRQSSVKAQTGKPERWRIIHAGIRDTVKLAIVKASRPRPIGANFSSVTQRRKWTVEECTGKVVTQWEIAADGLTRAQISPLGTMQVAGTKTVVVPNVLQPGYRSDVLVVFPEAGD
jgi:L-ascorbate oxidase